MMPLAAQVKICRANVGHGLLITFNAAALQGNALPVSTMVGSRPHANTLSQFAGEILTDKHL